MGEGRGGSESLGWRDEESYTPTQASKILRVSDRAVRKSLADGTLEGEQDDSGRWHVSQRAVHARLEDQRSYPRPAPAPREGPSAPRGSPEVAPEMLEIDQGPRAASGAGRGPRRTHGAHREHPARGARPAAPGTRGSPGRGQAASRGA